MAKSKNNKKSVAKLAIKNKKSKIHASVRHAKPVKSIKLKTKVVATKSVIPNSKLSLKDQAKQVAASLKQKEKVAEGRKRTNVSVSSPEDVKSALDGLFSNERAVEYLKKNVSKMAVDVI